MDSKELTNVPDYQKIRQTSYTAGGAGSNAANWDEDVEVLTPSPVVQHPLASQHTHLHPQPTWDGKQLYFGSSIHGLKAGWEPSYSSPIYSSNHPPHHNSRHPPKYTDSAGVQRRILGKNVSPNRRSFTEGLSAHDDDFSHQRSIKSSASQQNISHYSGSPSNYKENVSNSQFENRTHPGLIRKGNSTQNIMGYYDHPKKTDEQWKDIGGGHVTGKVPQDDLRSWQQQHQEELLHQHLETQALYENPSSQAQYSEAVLSKLNLDDSQSRWDPVRRAADSIIKEKNMIIDKLKNRILELEEDYQISESNLRQALIAKEDDTDIVKHKLQEMQHKNTNLKERLHEERARKQTEVDGLESKLGSAEHEIEQLHAALQKQELKFSELQKSLREKCTEAESWKKKCEESLTGHQELKKKLDSLQRYLDELPTVEESRLHAQQVLALREENASLKMRTENFEKKLSHARKILTARDFRIRELEDKEQELTIKLTNIQEEFERFEDKEKLEFDKSQLKQCQLEKERLAADLEKAKKLLETTHLKLRKVETKHQSDLRSALERLAQEEEAVHSLKEEVNQREGLIERMKKSLKEHGLHNQALVEENLQLKEELRQQEAQDPSISPQSLHTLLQQLGFCFAELQALVHVVKQRARGEDPDISLLLGVKGPENEAGAMAKPLISQWLLTVGELRREMDKMRAFICNRYAEDMGDNITCATQ
ncbi:centrosomal protein of 85 kDa-like isoform X2 [Physella acuta]|uniref:centrosomal protein of 85 kDa-like isoform X1 n=1 Tax=Physella acuta TaxID=109671 RepID=UPI0027DE6665|nr:centrosomal protein of 85 kDa-like isoform X1 [Physella acuta]XP_059153965.1 centrosomal protein of 85 kDa-like isoform X2 [Physella acuta]